MGNQDRELDALERQKQALALRLAGAPYARIAEQLGYRGTGGAHAAVKAALRKTLQEPADEIRTIEEERLNALLLSMWRQAQQGNQGAVDRCLKIMERRARLLGLDAPTKTDMEGLLTILVVYGDDGSQGPPAEAAS